MSNLTVVRSQDDFPQALVVASFGWTIPGWAWSAGVNTLVTANRIYYQPIFVDKETTFDRVGVYVGVGDGAGGLADIRIFNSTAGAPAGLVLSCGTLSTNAAGAQEIAISQALPRGLYFLAIRCDHAPELRRPGTTHGVAFSGIYNSNSQDSWADVCSYVDDVYADPAPAPSSTIGTQAFVRMRRA